MKAYACYCENRGQMTITLFSSREQAERETCDKAKIAEVEADRHTRVVGTEGTVFRPADQSYPALRAAIESAE